MWLISLAQCLVSESLRYKQQVYTDRREWNDRGQGGKKTIFSERAEFGEDEIYTFLRQGTHCFSRGMKFTQRLANVERTSEIVRHSCFFSPPFLPRYSLQCDSILMVSNQSVMYTHVCNLQSEKGMRWHCMFEGGWAGSAFWLFH